MENHSLLISIDALLDEKMLIIKGQQVLTDYDLAELLQVSVGYLRKKVKENLERFPNDFLFNITKQNFSKRNSSVKAKRRFYAFSWGGIMQAAGLFKTQ